MKKVLAIFLAFIIGLSMSAQIQNKLLGFTLGTTTKPEVRNKYKYDKGFNEDSSGDIFVKNIRFASNDWDYVHFHFYNNKLSSVDFSNVEPFTSIPIMESRWYNLKDRIYNKYGDYYLRTQSSMIMYSDGVTSIALNLSDDTGGMILMLYYSNDALIRQELQAGDDEL